MYFSDTTASGSISAQNTNPTTGVATANSTVVIDVRGMSTVTLQITTGTTTGVLTPQVTTGVNDGTATWLGLSATGMMNVVTGAYSATVAAATTGMWQVDVSGFSFMRISANAAMTGTAVMMMRASATAGMFALDAPIPAGANAIGTVTVVQPAMTDFALNSAATTNSTLVKATAGNLFELTITNFSAATKYVKFYRKATAPTVGTDVPIWTIEVLANSTRQFEFGANGKRFLTGIGYGITGAQADSDTTAVAAGDVKVHGSFI